MKQFLLTSVLLLGAATVQADTTVRVRDTGGPSIDQVQAMDAHGPQARIAVARFENKSADSRSWWNPQIGDGMADMLTTALVNTGRFIVLERGEALEDILGEQDLGASGRVRADTAAPIGEMEGAELLVVAAVTEFDENSGGTRGGLGGFGGRVLGAIAGGTKSAHMAIDLRLVDARTSRGWRQPAWKAKPKTSNLAAHWVVTPARSHWAAHWKPGKTPRVKKPCAR